MIEVEIPTTKRANYNFWRRREKRRKKKRIERSINDKPDHHQRHASYQQKTKQGSASNDLMKGYFWTMGGVAHATHSMLAPPVCLRVSYICLNFFYSNIKSPMILHVNNEKIYGKSPFRSFFFYVLTSNDILIVSLCFWFFLYFFQIQNCPSSYMIITKKTNLKVSNCPLMPELKFLLLRAFRSFHCIFKLKKTN